MHDSMVRLFLAAKRADEKIDSPTALARFLNESQQVVGNWNRRGVSRPGAIKAQSLIGCDSHWLLTGEGDMFRQSPKESSNGFSEMIRSEQDIDPYALINQALRRLVIVGNDKDAIIEKIRDRANYAIEVKRLFDDMLDKRKITQ